MPTRALGRSTLVVPAIGFGAFKIGRSLGAKYPRRYEVPDETQAAAILHGALDAGLTLIDTAPSYGLSEERIGRHVAARRRAFTLVTKVGEQVDKDGVRYDFSPDAIVASVVASIARLGGPPDVLLLHADARDGELAVDRETIEVLKGLRSSGLTRLIGFSGKSAEGNRAALPWADVLMVEYHLEDRSADALLAEARQRGVGTIIKKALASGRLDPDAAIRFVLSNPNVDCVVVGGLELKHLQANARIAAEVRGRQATK